MAAALMPEVAGRAAGRWRVVKLGGSLLQSPHAVSDLEQWLATQSSHRTLLVVGGGELADAVRRLDQTYGWDPLAAHVQAIRAMQVNAYVVCQQSARFHWVRQLSNLAAASWAPSDTSGGVMVLDPLFYLLYDEPQQPGARLPVGWQVTSDSIAARLAQHLPAEQLVLLKSTLPQARTLRGAQEEGLVDEYFSIAAAGLRSVCVVNLRDRSWPEVRLWPEHFG